MYKIDLAQNFLLSPTIQTNVIYYDEGLKTPETFLYFKIFKAEIKGIVIGAFEFLILQYIITEIRNFPRKPLFTVIVSGSTAEKVMKFLHEESFVNKVIIFCLDVDKYTPLLLKYKKLRAVHNSHENVLKLLKEDNYYLQETSFDLGESFRATPLLTEDEYDRYYNKYHKLLAQYFKDNYRDMRLYNEEMELFSKFVHETREVPNDVKDEIVQRIRAVENDRSMIKALVSALIKAYTSETQFCYGINMWLRNCDPNVYYKLKCFAGSLMYALNKYAEDNPDKGLTKNMTLYRRLTLRFVDINSYKTFENELICFPAFTSCATKDTRDYFPSKQAEKTRKELNPNLDQHVMMVISYVHKPGCVSIATNVGGISDCPTENEYIFPPFSFFKVTKVEMKKGLIDEPHIINLSVVNRRHLVELLMNKGKIMRYNSKTNELIMV